MGRCDDELVEDAVETGSGGVIANLGLPEPERRLEEVDSACGVVEAETRQILGGSFSALGFEAVD